MRRSRLVTLLVVVVFLLGLAQGLRALTLLLRYDFLAEFNLTLSLPYAIVSAAIWSSLLLVAAVGLWQRTRWGAALTGLAVTASQAQAWFDRWLFARSDYVQQTLGFDLVFSLSILIVTWMLLFWLQKKKT